MQRQQDLLNELLMQQRKQYIKLNEVMDITMQLAQAVDRNDEYSIGLLIAMRQEPMLAIDEVQFAIKGLLQEQDESVRVRLNQIMRGRGEVLSTDEERALDEQCQKNYRLLTRIVALDRPLNRKIGRDQAYYK